MSEDWTRTMSVIGRLAHLAVACAIAASPAAGQAAKGHCEPAVFSDSVEVAHVAKSRARVNFIKGEYDSKQCPSLAAACRSNAFLVAGDAVLINARRGDLVCATFANTKGLDTAGWLPASALQMNAHASAAVPSGWTGTWKRIEAEIRIKPALHGELVVDGTAVWGSNDPGRVRKGTVRNGEIAGKAKPDGDALFFADAPADSFDNAPSTDCAIRMRRIGPYLLVEDNKACGGMNVSFSGIYVRR